MSDLAIFPSPLPLDIEEGAAIKYKATKISLGMGGKGNVIADSSTLQSVSSIVIRLLLTTKGSVPNIPQRGSRLNNLLRQGYDPSSLSEDIVLILMDVEEQVKTLQLGKGLPPASLLESIELSSAVVLESTQLYVAINIKNKLGQSDTFDLVG